MSRAAATLRAAWPLLALVGCPERASTHDAAVPEAGKDVGIPLTEDAAPPFEAAVRRDARADTPARDVVDDAKGTDALDDVPAEDDAPAEDVGVDGTAADLPDAPRDVPPTDVAPSLIGIGRPCTASDTPAEERGDCADGQLCLRPPTFSSPGGYCSQRCDAVRCPDDAVCVAMVSGAYCMRRCASDADCRLADGYECYRDPWYGGVCAIRESPLGLRDGVAACFSREPGSHLLPALARAVFAEPNLPLSEGRADLSAAAEGNIVARPGGGAVAPYIADRRAATFIGTSSTHDGTSLAATAAVAESRPISSDPVLTYGRGGALHLAFIAFTYSGSRAVEMRIRLTRSDDDGATWSPPRDAVPADYCATGCDKPWLLAAPAPGGGENLYLAFAARRGELFSLMFLRSEDGGSTWSAPQPLAEPERVGPWQLGPNLLSFAAAPDGALSVTYLGTPGYSSVGSGSTISRVYLRRSLDGGRTWAEARRVSAPTDSVVFDQPVVALDGATTYVAYVAGTPAGAWDVVLATSVDQGVTWRHRRVHDEPTSCATHTLPALVADTTRHVAHLAWLENRFGDGAVAYAACPQDASAPCGRNEAVSDRSFTFTTSRDPTRWHGDYVGLAFAPPNTLWAAWSDTRTGRPQMYLARGRLR